MSASPSLRRALVLVVIVAGLVAIAVSCAAPGELMAGRKIGRPASATPAAQVSYSSMPAV